jgi:3-deoxy-7-phosphoheptulonate synthase
MYYQTSELNFRESISQQPNWSDHLEFYSVREALESKQPLVTQEECETLREEIARVGDGHGFILQAGDCVEPLSEWDAEAFTAKTDHLSSLSNQMKGITGSDILKIGRFAGQFGKPRSNHLELVNGVELPVFRGEIVNAPAPSLEARKHDPTRMLTAYEYSKDAMEHLTNVRNGSRLGTWSSHEALILDYEHALIREASDGALFLSSTHLPWIGDRTRDVNGPHVRFLSEVSNPVALKVGPSISPSELVKLCNSLNPEYKPGRLVLIIRLGVDNVSEHLRNLARAVKNAGHNPTWITDPVHGNTRKTTFGVKTRYVADVVNEIRDFVKALNVLKLHPGGLHIESTPFEVTECVGLGVSEQDLLSPGYTTLCDPRLNPEQADEIVRIFSTAI